MANPEHLKILKQGVEVWNRWREEKPEEQLKGHYTAVRDMALSFAELNELRLAWDIELRGVEDTDVGRSADELRATTRRPADLRDAELRYVNLEGAYLGVADLRGADLRGANLCHADLRAARLDKADLNQWLH